MSRFLSGVKPGTVIDHYTSVYGVHKGAYRAAHMIQIAVVVREYGRDFTNEQYTTYWAASEKTGWNHRREAVEVYGEDRWRDVAQLLADEMERQGVRSPAQAQRLVLAL